MPLAVNNGTSLNPQPSAAPAEENRVVNIPHRFQEGKLWCWAACMEMVLKHNGIEMSQCKIVQTMLNDFNHQCAPDFQSRDESCEPEQMAPTWRECGIKKVDPDNRALDIDEIKAEIAANRPIQVGILWHLGSGHSVLIKGWRATSPETLLIDDPLRDSPLGPDEDGSGRATHAELLGAFGYGSWDLTWKSLQKN